MVRRVELESSIGSPGVLKLILYTGQLAVSCLDDLKVSKPVAIHGTERLAAPVLGIQTGTSAELEPLSIG